MKVLFVVHRYAPFPGGSEYYVQNMAEEFLKRGNRSVVLAHEHQGNLNGVRVTNDYNEILNDWDMIIIHGCDCVSQNIVLQHLHLVKSPVCYMIIKPSHSIVAYNGLKNADYLAYSTSMDLEHIRNYGYESKARRVRHGIIPKIYDKDLEKVEYVSAGGFYPHKAMPELAKYWNETFPEKRLDLYGYADGEKPDYPNVKSYLGFDKEHVDKMIANAQGYIMNSYEEGFGLVLLESMLNRVPCYARNIAGAKDMAPYVNVYDRIEDLKDKIYAFELLPLEQKNDILQRNHEYVMTNHTITQTVNDLEDIINEKRK